MIIVMYTVRSLRASQGIAYHKTNDDHGQFWSESEGHMSERSVRNDIYF